MTTNPKATGSTEAPVVLTLGGDLSPAVAAIEKAFRLFQKSFPDTPDVTIVVKRDQLAWGHTTIAKVWAPAAAKDSEPADRFEIMISGENLKRGAVFVAATLLHEAAHARNLAKGVLDTDSNGRHNMTFKATAEEHGLKIENDGWHGWTKTELPPEGQKRWKRLIGIISRGLEKSAAAAVPSIDHLPGMGTPATPGTPTPPVPTGSRPVAPPRRGNRNLVKATCGCGFSIRASKGVLEKATPTCSACDEPFTP